LTLVIAKLSVSDRYVTRSGALLSKGFAGEV
jgi:hypothetical protein